MFRMRGAASFGVLYTRGQIFEVAGSSARIRAAGYTNEGRF